MTSPERQAVACDLLEERGYGDVAELLRWVPVSERRPERGNGLLLAWHPYCQSHFLITANDLHGDEAGIYSHWRPLIPGPVARPVCPRCHGNGTVVIFDGPGATNPRHVDCDACNGTRATNGTTEEQ